MSSQTKRDPAGAQLNKRQKKDWWTDRQMIGKELDKENIKLIAT